MIRVRSATVVLILLLLAACGEHGNSLVEPVAPEAAAPLTALDQAEPLACPADHAVSASGTIGILGGTIAAGDHRLTLPPGAVLLPTTFTVTAPASEHVELQVHARGHDTFHFLLPARITIGYDRCGSRPVDPGSLAVWHFDEVSGLLLELMGGTADAEDRSISFPTSHLSGFIIVN